MSSTPTLPPQFGNPFSNSSVLPSSFSNSNSSPSFETSSCSTSFDESSNTQVCYFSPTSPSTPSNSSPFSTPVWSTRKQEGEGGLISQLSPFLLVEEEIERKRERKTEKDEQCGKELCTDQMVDEKDQVIVKKAGVIVFVENYSPKEEETNPIISLDEEEPPPVIPRGELPKVMSATFAPEVETQLRVLDFVNHYLIQNGPVAAAVTTYQLLKLCGKIYLWMAYGQQREQTHPPDSETKLKSLADESLVKDPDGEELAASGDSAIDEEELAQWFSIDPESPALSRRKPKFGSTSRSSLPSALPSLSPTFHSPATNEDLTQSIAGFLEKEGMVFLEKKQSNIYEDILVNQLCANDRGKTIDHLSDPKERPWGERERILSIIRKIADEHLKPKNLYLYQIVKEWVDKYSNIFEKSIDEYVHPENTQPLRRNSIDKIDDWENADLVQVSPIIPPKPPSLHSVSSPTSSSEDPSTLFLMMDENSPSEIPLWGEHHQMLWTAKQYKSILGIDRPELWRHLHLLGYLIGLSPHFLMLCATAEGVFMLVSLLEELAKHLTGISSPRKNLSAPSAPSAEAAPSAPSHPHPSSTSSTSSLTSATSISSLSSAPSAPIPTTTSAWWNPSSLLWNT